MSVHPLVHIKCLYDPDWNYGEIARDLFGPNKCLVVAEKLCTNAHVHFQGYCPHPDGTVEEFISDLANDHFVRKAPKVKNPETGKEICPRPVKRARRDVDEKGFQYMCKEDRPPLYVQGFTDQELTDLRANANAVMLQYKKGLEEVVHSLELDLAPDANLLHMHTRILVECADWYKSIGKRPGPGFQKQVTWCIFTHPKANKRIRESFAHKL